MNKEIEIKKTTAYLFAGLAILLLVGWYIGFSTASAVKNTKNETDDSTANIGIDTQTTIDNADTVDNLGVSGGQAVQEVYIQAKSDGTYSPEEIIVSVNRPVRVHFTTEGNVGCGAAFYLYGLDLYTVSRNGQEGVIEFTPTETGTYEYNCGMHMWSSGKLIVK